MSSKSSQTNITVNPAPLPSYSVALSATPSTVIAGETSTLKADVTPQNGAPTPTSYAWNWERNDADQFNAIDELLVSRRR